MSADLCAALEARFPGARPRLAAGGATVELEVELDGASYRARLAMGPSASIAVGLPCIDGFELRLQWTDRWTTGGSPRAPSFDDSFLIETNDLALATLWLDHRARAGLLASRYVAARRPERDTALMLRDVAWVYEVAGDEVSARRREAEPSVQRMADVLGATLVLASLPARWARAFGSIGRALGGEPAGRVEIGGKPILRLRRGSVDVLVHIVRRLGPADAGRLRTIVGAHRTGSGGETLSLVDVDLPRAAWPPASGPSSGALRLDARAADLLDLARPSATHVRPHDVEIAFDGALLDGDRLGAAIELAAHWAQAAHAGGPYR